MSSRAKAIRDILFFALVIFLSFYLTPLPKSYESVSYAEFMKMLNDQDISSISYSESEKYAIIHQTSSDKDLKVGIVSPDSFEKDVYTYSLNNSEFTYSNTVPAVQVDVFSRIMIFITILCIYRFIIFSAFIKISLPSFHDTKTTIILNLHINHHLVNVISKYNIRTKNKIPNR